LNNAVATIMALSKYKYSDYFNALREKKAEKEDNTNNEEKNIGKNDLKDSSIENS